jgi:hypothetical protein
MATVPTGSRVNSGKAAPPSFRRELPPHLQQDGASSVKTGQVMSEQEPSGQAHPYATVQSTPHQARPAALPIRHGDQAYTTTAKIHNEKVASDIYNHAMELPITITQRELLSLAPELRAQVADTTVKWRIPREMAQVMIEEIDEHEEEQECTQLMHMPASFATAASSRHAEDIVTDTHEQYLKTTQAPTDLQDDIQVAAESNALRTILPVVNGQDQVEAILDPGCQVVAMLEEVCNALAIAYDPDIRLSMVSANRGVDQSLRLACNVSFLVGDITLYLQVHILHSPAYNILLGRPFDNQEHGDPLLHMGTFPRAQPSRPARQIQWQHIQRVQVPTLRQRNHGGWPPLHTAGTPAGSNADSQDSQMGPLPKPIRCPHIPRHSRHVPHLHPELLQAR